jgi:putative phage-type endonuclease
MEDKKTQRKHIRDTIRGHTEEGRYYNESELISEVISIRKIVSNNLSMSVDDIDGYILEFVHIDKKKKKKPFIFNAKVRTSDDHNKIYIKIREEDSVPDSPNDDDFEAELDRLCNLDISKISVGEYVYSVIQMNNPIKKTDEANGPYGTQWIHDKQVDDKWGPEHVKRSKQFNKLRAIILPEQRTPEWFQMRETCISASDGALVVDMNPYEQQFKIVYKKGYQNLLPFESNMHCYHGKKLEEIATMIYEYRMNVKVDDFGLMKHPTISFLGASPDGIVSQYKHDGIHKTKYVGRMLEIKCPAVRKINMSGPDVIYEKHTKDAVCPTYYWIQVQLQLECCDLDECDFWQCTIDEYKTRDDFVKDTDPTDPFRSKLTGFEKGCLIQLVPKSKIADSLISKNNYDHIIWDDTAFIYPPKIEMTPEECDAWVAKELATLHSHPIYSTYVLDKVIYWKLVISKNITIPRDRKWFKDNYKAYEDIWKYISFIRENKLIADLLVKYANSIEPLMDRPYRKTKKEKEEGEKNNKLIMDMIKRLCNPDEPGYDKLVKKLTVELESDELLSTMNDELDDGLDDSEQISKVSSKKSKKIQNIKEESVKAGLVVNSFGSAFID